MYRSIPRFVREMGVALGKTSTSIFSWYLLDQCAKCQELEGSYGESHIQRRTSHNPREQWSWSTNTKVSNSIPLAWMVYYGRLICSTCFNSCRVRVSKVHLRDKFAIEYYTEWPPAAYETAWSIGEKVHPNFYIVGSILHVRSRLFIAWQWRHWDSWRSRLLESA